MKGKISALIAIICCLAIITSGCRSKSESRYFFAMHCQAVLVIEDGGNYGELSDRTGNLLNEIECSVSATAQNSRIYKFNEAEAGATVELDKTAFDLLTVAKEAYALTDGYYNPAVYYSVREYGFDGTYDYPKTAEELPDSERIEKFRALSEAFSEVKLSEEDGKYYAVKPASTAHIDGVTYSLKLDLGGMGKGYAVDRVAELIESYGYEYGYFNFARSSMLCKQTKKRESGAYMVGFVNPRGRSEFLQTAIKDSRLSTSGDYDQFYVIDGVRYCHVIDPTTGKPVQTGIMSATVIGGSAAEDDALTTAIMAMGKERAIAFTEKYLTDRRVLFTYEEDGAYKFYTNMPEGSYTVKDGSFTL